jgi:Flp pilus assembly pilin Flp
MKKLFKLKKNKDGVTAIEFAIVAPVFFLIFLGIIEVGLTMFVDSTMNTALRSAARQGIPDGYDSGDKFRNVMQGYMGGIYATDDTGMVITVISIPPPTIDSSGKINLGEANNELLELEKFATNLSVDPSRIFTDLSDDFRPSLDDQSGAITIYAARYEWGGFTKMVGAFLPDYLYAVSIVRNEVFDGASPTPTPTPTPTPRT